MSDYFPGLPPIMEQGDRGPVIPLLGKGFVPQGVAWVEGRQVFLVSGNFSGNGEKDGPMAIAVIPKDKKEPAKVLKIMKGDKVFSGHAGGICIAGDDVWLADQRQCWRLPLEALFPAKPTDSVTVGENDFFTTESFADTVTFHDGVLWVAEYAGGSYQPDKHHRKTDRGGKVKQSWASGYQLNPVTGWPEALTAQGDRQHPLPPERALVIPDRVQGICMVDGKVVLSASKGRNVRSQLMAFQNPLAEKPHARGKTASGTEIPLWFLDVKNHLRTVSVSWPPWRKGLCR